MVRNLVRVTVIPFMIGLLTLGNIKEESKRDFSMYSTEGLELCYDVPLPQDVVPEMEYTYIEFPYTGNMYVGFKEALAFKESRGNYFSINTFGYLGKYQFGKSTLKLIGIRDTYSFLNNPSLQEEAFLLNTSRNKWVLRRDIARYSGRWIGGIKITESGILAAAHLAGPGGIQDFLRSGGVTDFKDGYGTTIQSYLKKFSGYDVSFVKPIKRAKITFS